MEVSKVMKISHYIMILSILLNTSVIYSTDKCSNKSWQSIQAEAQNAVVQVFVVTRNFNWFNPYIIHGTKQGSGTGFFINKEGEIATCSHVVEDALAVFIGIPFLGKKLLRADVVSICP